MTDQEHEPREQDHLAPREGAEEYRSATGMVFQGAMALGAATGGLGTLGLGAAAVKQAFGSEQSPEPQPRPAEQPSGEHRPE
jgi:hypothetical protein